MGWFLRWLTVVRRHTHTHRVQGRQEGTEVLIIAGKVQAIGNEELRNIV